MRKLVVVALLAVTVALVAAGAVFAGDEHGRGHGTFTVFGSEHALAMIPVTAGKFSLGDRVALSDDLFTEKGGRPLGSDGGECTVVRVTDAATGSGVLQCLVSFQLPGGVITTQALNTLTGGVFVGTQTGAITGGTGRFRGASGEFSVQFLTPSEVNITFFLDD
jgi:hypothetical protein